MSQVSSSTAARSRTVSFELDGPVELTRPNVMYTFADPTLEARPAGQKLLLRMGPDNADAIKAKLGELRAIITAAPPAR